MGLFSKKNKSKKVVTPSLDLRVPLADGQEESAAQRIAEKCWERGIEIFAGNPDVDAVVAEVSDELNYSLSWEDNVPYTRVLGRATMVCFYKEAYASAPVAEQAVNNYSGPAAYQIQFAEKMAEGLFRETVQNGASSKLSSLITMEDRVALFDSPNPEEIVNRMMIPFRGIALLQLVSGDAEMSLGEAEKMLFSAYGLDAETGKKIYDTWKGTA